MASSKVKTRTIISATVTLALVAVCGYFFEEFKEWFPWLTTMQIRSYSWMTGLEARKPRPKFVIGVEIDDATFATLNLPIGGPTRRSALAKVVENLVEFHPAVIALDINLSSDPAADEAQPRKSENANLLASFHKAASQTIPVVLTCSFDRDGRRLSNVFADETLPHFGDPGCSYRTRVGFDNSASDLRKIPLTIDRLSPQGKSTAYDSFALEVAQAYEDRLGILPRTSKRLTRHIEERNFVYASFLAQNEIPHISATSVLKRDTATMSRISHRIVLIGGNRHAGAGSNEWLDDHGSPPLNMRGMYFHANYIEGLLDDRIRSDVPRWTASLVDVVLGVLMIYFSRKGESLKARLALMGVFFVPVILAYVASANLGYVFDFVLPLLLLFIHIIMEHYFHLRETARERGMS
ncbi:MAG: hypothetical protein JWQ87_3557 [Candidatus Sulfotelmatobacter sp.]|nr:hypothetical protein [Candidatus Sulfotelmatobacter sp.]